MWALKYNAFLLETITHLIIIFWYRYMNILNYLYAQTSEIITAAGEVITPSKQNHTVATDERLVSQIVVAQEKLQPTVLQSVFGGTNEEGTAAFCPSELAMVH